MYKYEVGELLHEGVIRYQEGIRFDFDQDGPTLQVFFENPTPDEIMQMKQGNFKIGYWQHKDIIFILTKFGDLEWMDAPYNIHLSKSFTLATPEESQGYGLTIYFVDASTGILKVMRLIGLEHEFSLKLKEAIEAQGRMPFDKVDYANNISICYRTYSTKDMLKYATRR